MPRILQPLLIILTLSAVGSAVLADEEEAIKKLKDLGGKFSAGRPVKLAIFPKSQIDDEDAKLFKELPALEQLMIRDSRITDKGLEQIGSLKNMQTLDLAKTPGVTAPV